MVGGVHHCFVDFERDTPLIKHLESNRPPELKEQIRFRELGAAEKVNGLIVYPVGTGAIQVRQTLAEHSKNGHETISVFVWHPDGDPTALAPYEAWFWRECRKFYADRVRKTLKDLIENPSFDVENDWTVIEAHKRFQEQVAGSAQRENVSAPIVPDLEIHRKGLGGKVLDFRAAVATGLVVFALYFACVYLLPTLNCEERERGVLLAQALSPASPTEIVAAKFLFYPLFGIALAATLAAIYKTEVLSSLFFWLALLRGRQRLSRHRHDDRDACQDARAAFLGGMCYLLGLDGTSDLLDQQHPSAAVAGDRVPRPANPPRGTQRECLPIPLGPSDRRLLTRDRMVDSSRLALRCRGGNREVRRVSRRGAAGLIEKRLRATIVVTRERFEFMSNTTHYCSSARSREIRRRP